LLSNLEKSFAKRPLISLLPAYHLYWRPFRSKAVNNLEALVVYLLAAVADYFLNKTYLMIQRGIDFDLASKEEIKI